MASSKAPFANLYSSSLANADPASSTAPRFFFVASAVDAAKHDELKRYRLSVANTRLTHPVDEPDDAEIPPGRLRARARA